MHVDRHCRVGTLAEYDHRDQNAHDEDEDREQIDVVGKPGFFNGHGIGKEGRQIFGGRKRGGGLR